MVPGASASGGEPSPGAVPAHQIFRRVTCHVSRVACLGLLGGVVVARSPPPLVARGPEGGREVPRLLHVAPEHERYCLDIVDIVNVVGIVDVVDTVDTVDCRCIEIVYIIDIVDVINIVNIVLWTSM